MGTLGTMGPPGTVDHLVHRNLWDRMGLKDHLQTARSPETEEPFGAMGPPVIVHHFGL